MNKVKNPNYPSLYQINTRVWLTELSLGLDRKATLDDIPDIELDQLAEMGFDWIWFLSVWSTGRLHEKSRVKILNGDMILKRHFRIFRKRILLVQDLQSPDTRCILTLAVMKP